MLLKGRSCKSTLAHSNICLSIIITEVEEQYAASAAVLLGLLDILFAFSFSYYKDDGDYDDDDDG